MDHATGDAVEHDALNTPDFSFPLRAAGIDIGSNAMRLVVGEFTAPGAWRVLAQQRVPVRLGASVFGAAGGRLDEVVIEAALAALATFRRQLDELDVGIYRGAATSAVREATNGADFLEQAHRTAGIRLELITSGEEARLVWRAVSDRVAVAGRRWVLVDVGGGSVEVALADGRDLLFAESHRMGTVRLLREFQHEQQRPEQFRRLVQEYVETLASTVAADGRGERGVVATGGNIEELARLCDARPDPSGGLRLPLADLETMIDELSAMTPAERIARYRLRPDRADVIVPAGLMYERVAHLARVDHLLVPGVGVREGLMLDAVDNAAAHREHVSRQERELASGAVALGRRYQFDEAHARHVARLSLQLFDQLQERHGLGEADRRILMTAALLHDIGQFIAHRRHHKHSYYLIAHSSLPDLEPAELQLVALVARYHRRAEPSKHHRGYADLDKRERRRVDRLAALLRIADALDRQHRQHVRQLTARVRDDTLVLRIDADADVALERWAVEKKGRLSRRALGLELRVEPPGA